MQNSMKNDRAKIILFYPENSGKQKYEKLSEKKRDNVINIDEQIHQEINRKTSGKNLEIL